MNKHDNHKRGHAAWITAGAVALVAAASLLSWEDMTDGKIKDFDLFSDIRVSAMENDTTNWVEEAIDISGPLADHISISAPSVQDVKTRSTDTGENASDTVPSDYSHRTKSSEASCIVEDMEGQSPMPERKPSRIGELTVIEDYSATGRGLDNIREALDFGRMVRIAVVGDSYIEGDIMTQDLRAKLQEAYGGRGVGYMNMHSEFPGFRRSVTQSGKGWKCYSATHRGQERYMGLSEEYAVAQGSATAEYKGAKRVSRTDRWDKSTFLFVAPEGGEIKTRTSAGEWITHNVAASPSVQAIMIDSATSQFGVSISSPSVISLGVWLDGKGKGVSVDCMSSRGIPGYTLAKVPSELCHEMSEWVDYDLIILEFGINVLSARQRNYSQFCKNMEGVIRHLRECYPSARILLMGIGDRGEKRDGRVRSMSTVPIMIEAQRNAARATGALFWDTREAMGGDDAIVEWAKKGFANKDYIHLSHKGGEQLASSLADAIKRMIDR